MSEELTREQFHRAMQHLLAQVAWRPVERLAGHGDDGLPYATHEGVLHLPYLGDVPCYQLSTGERVFDAETVVRLLGLDEEEGA